MMLVTLLILVAFPQISLYLTNTMINQVARMTEPAFSFMTATDIRFGRGTAGTAPARIGALGRRVFVVHGADPARADWLCTGLGSGLAARFACPAEPDLPLIETAVSAARDAAADVVVALGGGAALDTGKAVAALVPATRPVLDHLEVVGQGLPLDNAPLPFVALPTTAGTGAEVTRNAVIGVPRARRKVSLRDPRMLADLVIVDPALTDALPKAQTLASGLDAVTQVIEPYISTRANRLTDLLCRDAIPLGLGALVRLMEGEDPAARDDLAWTSLCGGLALANAGLGAVHGLAGPLGGVAPAPHGAVCGALLPHVLTANARHADGPLRTRIAEVEGWVATTMRCPPDRAASALAAWAASHGLPRLADMGVAERDLDAVAEAAGSSSSMKGNPVPLAARDLRAILDAAF